MEIDFTADRDPLRSGPGRHHDWSPRLLHPLAQGADDDGAGRVLGHSQRQRDERDTQQAAGENLVVRVPLDVLEKQRPICTT